MNIICSKIFLFNISKIIYILKYVFYIKNKLFRCKSTDLAKVQTAIFEVKENIEKLMSIFSVNPLIAKRLTNLDDAEIINCLYLIIYINK